MTPRQHAEAYYAENTEGPSLAEDMRRAWSHGLLVDTPAVFLMARPVCSRFAPFLITNTALEFPRDNQDCWHVQFLAGDMRRAFDLVPYPLPFVSMERHANGRSRLVILQYRELRRLVCCAKLAVSHRHNISQSAGAARTETTR